MLEQSFGSGVAIDDFLSRGFFRSDVLVRHVIQVYLLLVASFRVSFLLFSHLTHVFYFLETANCFMVRL